MRRPHRAATRIAARYPFLDLVEHTLTDARGRAPRTIVTFAMPDWVTVVPVTERGELVLVRQHRHGVDAATIEPPGGIVDPGEDPAASALRELREETGYEAAAVEPLGWVHPNPALQDNRCHLFLARGVRLAGAPADDPDEETEPVLFDAQAARAALEEGAITHALAVVALERALARLGLGMPGAPADPRTEATP